MKLNSYQINNTLLKINKEPSFTAGGVGTVIGLKEAGRIVATRSDFYNNEKRLNELERDLKQYEPEHLSKWVPLKKKAFLKRVFFDYTEGNNVVKDEIQKVEREPGKYKQTQGRLGVSI